VSPMPVSVARCQEDGAYTLEKLLAPVPLAEFRTRYWEREFLFISRNDPSFYRSLFSLQDVDRCIFSRRTDPRPSLALVPSPQKGQPAQQFRISEVSMDRLYGSFNAGDTIRLERLQESWGPIALLVAALEEALVAKLNVNFYLTPPASQGFKIHYDFHDSLILQVDGAKDWSIYAPEIELPLETSTFLDLPEVAEVRIEEGSTRLLRNIRLESGDLLYIPRGFPHKAVTAGATSLHLTVGIHPVYWLDVLKLAIERACAGEASLRRSLTPGFSTDPEILDQMRGAFAPLLQQACGKASFDAAMETLLRERFAAQQYPPDGHFAQWREIDRLESSDQLGRRPGLLCKVEMSQAEAMLHFATNVIRGPLSVLPAFEFIRDHSRFRIGELPGLTEKSQVVLARRAIREGLLSRLPGEADAGADASSHHAGARSDGDPATLAR
jgi:lysine-specific demethylase/histidyl-hydroxylase NO66